MSDKMNQDERSDESIGKYKRIVLRAKMQNEMEQLAKELSALNCFHIVDGMLLFTQEKGWFRYDPAAEAKYEFDIFEIKLYPCLYDPATIGCLQHIAWRLVSIIISQEIEKKICTLNPEEPMIQSPNILGIWNEYLSSVSISGMLDPRSVIKLCDVFFEYEKNSLEKEAIIK